MNGEQAIRLFEKNTYDIVFLDIKLPDMSGFDIAHYLRKNYEEGIYDFLPPLIAFTANVMHSEEEYQSREWMVSYASHFLWLNYAVL